MWVSFDILVNRVIKIKTTNLLTLILKKLVLVELEIIKTVIKNV